MKKYFILLFLILFSIFVISFKSNTNDSYFDYILNGNNIICYNVNIDKQEIEDFYYHYASKVKQFYIDNGLTTRRIELEKLIIILCINSFGEWDKEKKLKDKLINEFKYLSLDNIKNYQNISEYDYYADALYYRDEEIPIIILKSSDNKIIKYFKLLIEYNHHLIYRNPNKQNMNFLSSGVNVFDFWIDDGFTNFLGYYFGNIDYYKYIDKYEEYLKDEVINLSEKDSKIIFDMLRNDIYTYDAYKIFKFQNIFDKNYKIDEGSDFFRYLLYNYRVMFYAYLHFSRGTENLYKYLYYLYNEYYSSIDDIFKSCYNISFMDYLKELDEKLMSK